MNIIKPLKLHTDPENHRRFITSLETKFYKKNMFIFWKIVEKVRYPPVLACIKELWVDLTNTCHTPVNILSIYNFLLQYLWWICQLLWYNLTDFCSEDTLNIRSVFVCLMVCNTYIWWNIFLLQLIYTVIIHSTILYILNFDFIFRFKWT